MAKKQKPQKSKNVMARTGRSLGISALATFFMIVTGWAIGIPGIVMSSIGLKADNPVDKKKAKVGLGLSISAVILATVEFVVCVVVLPVLAAQGKLG